MENATKALLIAAAVLITILVISLGVVIYTKASEAVDGAIDMSEYQIKQFNEKFLKYQGKNVSGSDVNAMLQTVFNHNNAQPTADTCVEVTDSINSSATIAKSNTITSAPNKVNIGARYSITITVDTKTKLVKTIAIGNAT